MKEGTKKNLGLVLVDRSKLEYYDVVAKKIYVFNFSEKLIADLEIIGRRELETQMFLFINYYKLHPVNLIMLLSDDVCFEKLITDTQEANFENTVNQFLLTVPFEEAVHKIYRQVKGHLLLAVNRDLIENFRFIFSKMGFYIQAVVPISVIGINVKTIDNAASEFILAKAHQIKELSLIAVEVESRDKKTDEKKLMGVKRVFILISVFIVLLSILLFLLYQQAAGIT